MSIDTEAIRWRLRNYETGNLRPGDYDYDGNYPVHVKALLDEVERLSEAWRMAEPILTERDTLARAVERLSKLAEEEEEEAR